MGEDAVARALDGEGTSVHQRAPWGSITRDQVVDLALREVRGGSYGQMTIRSLASTLGVSPMSLYRHVRNRDDLLDEVTDRLLAEVWRPRISPSDWRAWTLDAAKRLHRLLVTQPAALHVYLRHPVTTPAARARMEAMLAVLADAGFAERAALDAYAALHTYTIGFAALEASRNQSGPVDRGDMARSLAAFTSARRFVQGLHYLLVGIEREAGIA